MKTMLKLLFVEDDPHSVLPAKQKCEKDLPSECVVKDFSEAKDWILVNRPDLVILDLLRGSPSEPEVAGQETYEFIWENQFCPIIIHSAQPDAESDRRPDHPFVRTVQKGSASAQGVVDAVKELLPHVEAVRQAEQSIRKSFSRAMRDVAPDAFRINPHDIEECNRFILRAGRRRVAALMDDLCGNGEKLAHWEHYICPPISSDIKLGDVLRTTQSNSNEDPSTFFVVLTPSCDLVASGVQTPRVKNVLVAACCSMPDGLKLTSLNGANLKKLKQRLPNLLSQGFFETIIPIPGLKQRIPSMTANLKNLSLIPIGEIGDNGKKYLRVASIDSPFRELVSWAYLQIACRPGLPDRDFNSWSDEIIEILKSAGSD